MAEKMEVSGRSAAPLCANGCGFFGGAATMNLCSMCYKEHLIKTAADQAAAPGPVAETKIEDTKAAAAADHVPEQSTTGQDPDTAAAAVATATPVAAVSAVEETGGCVQTTQEQGPFAIECANGCGFFGSAATNNMCSTCYRDFINPAPAPAAEDKTVGVLAAEHPEALISAATSTTTAPAVVHAAEHPEVQIFAANSSAVPAVEAPAVKAAANRCASCRKKVGLLGFPCRCGGTFCSLHRHAEKHACDFDYKTADRDKLAKNNPLVVAAKINKI